MVPEIVKPDTMKVVKPAQPSKSESSEAIEGYNPIYSFSVLLIILLISIAT
jgi:hypothetical protein